ncbi:MAG: tetratricopeptide repeat protein [candidate division Zixibacteria bacterium]|nr:tetratricopeptide repeat protein [candidate division Zixibacteria bacterium]
MRYWKIIIGLFLCSYSIAWAAESPAQADSAAAPRDIFLSANQAYDNKDFTAAAEGYQTLLDQGFKTASVYYNLGNALFRQGDLGQAILNYRKALKLDPGDEDTRANLEFARLYQSDEIVAPPSFFLTTFWKNVWQRAGLNGLAWFSALFWWLLLLCLTALVIFNHRDRFTKLALGVSLVLFLFFSLSLVSRINQEKREFAVILTQPADVRSGPGEDYTVLFNLHPGLECELQEQRGEWYLVILENGSKGWIPQNSLGKI